jgi:hypothetical protein
MGNTRKEGKLGEKYYLVNDDEIMVAAGHAYRVRIWRRPGHAVVLTEPVGGSPPPDLYSKRLANQVARQTLGFSAINTTWYEHCKWRGRERAFHVKYEVVGQHPLRPMLIEPAYRPVAWAGLNKALTGGASSHAAEATTREEGDLPTLW